MPTESEAPLLDRPYAERQFIMVFDDAIAEVMRLREQLEEAEAKAVVKLKDTEDWTAFAAMVVGLAFPVTRFAALGDRRIRGCQAWN